MEKTKIRFGACPLRMAGKTTVNEMACLGSDCLSFRWQEYTPDVGDVLMRPVCGFMDVYLDGVGGREDE